jgi:hypothetical protein
LAQEVAEVGDGVGRIAEELALGLAAVELFSLDVRERRRNLAFAFFTRDDLGLAFLRRVSVCSGAGSRPAYSGGVGDGAVRVAKGQPDCNPLRGVGLRTHLWRAGVGAGAVERRVTAWW